MKRLAIALVIASAAAGCSSGGAGTPQSAADSAAVAAAGADWEPLARATSPCGRYTLRLEFAEWRDEPGARPQLSLQFALRTLEPDVLLAGDARITDLVPPDGAEFRFGDLKGTARALTDSRTLAFHGLEVYHRDDRLRRLRVEARVLRVLAWKTYDVSCEGPAASSEFVCAPYTVSVSGDSTLPEVCHVGACVLDGWRDFPAHQRDLFGILGHDWVAGSAILTDARGRKLRAHGGAGTGGASSVGYGPDLFGDPTANAPPAPITWPVRGTIRLPDRYVVEVVPFEFTDCTLTRGVGPGGR